MNKVVIIPEENAIQLLSALNEFKRIYQNQIIGDSNSAPDNYLSEKQAADFLKCSISKLQIFRKNGSIKYFKFGRSISYSQEVLNKFIDSNSHGSGSGGLQ